MPQPFDLGNDFGDAGRAQARVLFQHAVHQLRHRFGDLGGQRRDWVLDVRQGDVDLGGAGEGAPTRQGLVSNHAQGVDVARSRGFFSHGLFGGQVLGRPHHHPRRGQSLGARRQGNPKVRQFRHAFV